MKPGSQDSAVGVASGYRLDDQEVGVRVLVGLSIFTMLFKPVLRSIQSHIQLALGGLLPQV